MVAMLAFACTKPPPPAPPKPEPVVEAPKPPEPPKPPPKCESLDEHCAATASTRARIGRSGLVLTPPEGWTYAQTEENCVASSKDAAAMAVATHATGKPQQLLANLHGTFDALLSAMGLAPVKPKPYWWLRPADKVEKVGDLKVSLWQIDGGARGDKHGPLVLFSAPLPDGRAMLGAGFVPSDDKTNADQAILKAVESIANAGDGGKPSTYTPDAP
jgi:hypothetical protein